MMSSDDPDDPDGSVTAWLEEVEQLVRDRFRQV
jgi:hypothetical protein